MCFKHTLIFFRQWNRTSVEGDSGAAAVLPLMFWQPWIAFDVWACLQQNSPDGKPPRHQILLGFPLWLGKSKTKVSNGLHPDDVSLNRFLCSHFTYFCCFCCFSHGKKFFSVIPSKTCNIHTISPLNCTQKNKNLFGKWTLAKVQKKDVKEWWQKEVY